MRINGFLLLVPFLLIRFGLLSYLSKDAVARAAHFPAGFQEKHVIYCIYQLSSVGIFIYSCFLTVSIERCLWFWIGMVLYGLGLTAGAVSMIGFSAPAPNGMRRDGIYRFSRNPMYVSYFLCFAGCAVLTRSLALWGFVMVFQISGHWLVLPEEEWCLEQFGEEYRQYMRDVRRYI